MPGFPPNYFSYAYANWGNEAEYVCGDPEADFNLDDWYSGDGEIITPLGNGV